MAEHPPIPGVDLDDKETIVGHGNLLGYDWWITRVELDEGPDRYVADIILPFEHPLAQAYQAIDGADDVFQGNIDSALRVPYNDDMPHRWESCDQGLRVFFSSHHVRWQLNRPHEAVEAQMRSMILAFHELDTPETMQWAGELKQALAARSAADERVEQLLERK